MATQPVAVAHDMSRSRSLPWALLSYLALGLAALLPRVLDLGVFLTGDEANFWLRRSDVFMRALRSGDYAATAVSTHPGVTTMWLGSAGLLLQDKLLDSGIVRDGSFATFLALARLPTALVHTAAIVLGFALLRRMLSAPAAFLAALLWAADPFVIGYSRVLHVDALAGSFATLSLLAACLYWNHERRRGDLIVSGVCAGLAILSKSPALALLPVVGLIALAAAWRQPRIEDRESKIEDRVRSRFVAKWCMAGAGGWCIEGVRGSGIGRMLQSVAGVAPYVRCNPSHAGGVLQSVAGVAPYVRPPGICTPFGGVCTRSCTFFG